MNRRMDEGTAPNVNVNFSDLAQIGARQVEAFFEVQASMAQRIQDANASSLKRLETAGGMGWELASRLMSAQSVADATTAWQEWAATHFRLAAVDAKRMLGDAQAVFSEGASAIGKLTRPEGTRTTT